MNHVLLRINPLTDLTLLLVYFDKNIQNLNDLLKNIDNDILDKIKQRRLMTIYISMYIKIIWINGVRKSNCRYISTLRLSIH